MKKPKLQTIIPIIILLIAFIVVGYEIHDCYSNSVVLEEMSCEEMLERLHPDAPPATILLGNSFLPQCYTLTHHQLQFLYLIRCEYGIQP